MRFDGGRVCLDLAATDEYGEAAGEDLRDSAALSRWLYGAGIVPAATAIPAERGWLVHFHELRALLRRLVACEVDGGAAAAEDIAALNCFARPAPPAPAAVRGRSEGGPGAAGEPGAARAAGTQPAPRAGCDAAQDPGLRKRLAAPPTWEALVSVVARDAVDLLTDPAARDRLRRCEGERCSRVYLDTSRGRRRRWCSSERCGNRERVARHRRRTTLTASQG
jgi:predicted RNA-binding Zn ribbon-like protein